MLDPPQHVRHDSVTLQTCSDQNQGVSDKTTADSGKILANSGMSSDHAVAPPPPPPLLSLANIDAADPNLQYTNAKNASKGSIHDQIVAEMNSKFHDGKFIGFKRTTFQIHSSPPSADSNDINSAAAISPGRQRAERVTRPCASCRENTDPMTSRPIRDEHFDAPRWRR